MSINNFSEINETVVLFDMDGTLTPARKSLSPVILPTLRVVSTQAKIGIVTGSPYDYMCQQISGLWGPDGLSKDRIILMPCNGTQVYLWNKESADFEKVYSTDFKEFLSAEFGSTFAGRDAYTSLIKDLLELQLDYFEEYNVSDVSGHFVSYRESLLNWSMIGRDASHELRQKFEVVDRDYRIRDGLRNSLRVRLDTSGLDAIECVLGGTTSIDIYPKGWDKTHALRHLEGADIWFWGDRCEPGGNDYELYKKLGPCVRSFVVTDPNDCARSLRANLDIDWEYGDLIVGNLEINQTVGSD